MGKIITKCAGLFVLFRVFFCKGKKKKVKTTATTTRETWQILLLFVCVLCVLEREIGKYDFESFFCVRMMFLDSLFVCLFS